MESIDSVSYETVRRGLKKNALKPWLKQQGLIPPKPNNNFVAQMEQVLDVYKRPYDIRYLVVCLDESPRQLIRERRLPVGMKPGRNARHDDEDDRCGGCHVFMAVEPLAGKRKVHVTKQRTKTDWALFIESIAQIY